MTTLAIASVVPTVLALEVLASLVLLPAVHRETTSGRCAGCF